MVQLVKHRAYKKVCPAIQSVLKILKENAETEFEKLSVARLETALLPPPVAEAVDETHQIFNGVIYKKKTA